MITKTTIRNDILPLGIVLMLAFTSFQHALDGNFVFDDTVAIVKNRDVTQIPTNLTAIFSHDFWGDPLIDANSHKSYRPLTILMFNAEYAHWHLKSKHMKLINLLLHCLNSGLVWKLINNMQFKQHPEHEEISMVTAALFAVHPVHTEAVAGIVGRTELMFCLCFLLALILTTGNRRPSSYSTDIAAICLSTVGILFKESAIVILPTCAFANYIRMEYISRPLKQQLHILISRRNFTYICATLLIFIWRIWIQNFEAPQFKEMDNAIAFSSNIWTRILSQSFLYVLNIWILLCPQWLCFDWALGCVDLIEQFTDVRILSILSMYILIVLLLYRCRKNRYMLFGFGMLTIPFIPASGIIKVGFVIAERVLYVPSIGICFLLAYSFAELKSKTKKRRIIRLYKVLLIFVFICYTLKTRERAVDWLTEEKLFSSALNVCPKNAKVHYNIACLASDNLERQKALNHYHKAIDLYPNYASALMNLGNLYRDLGDLESAEKYLRASLEASQDFAAAWMNLGIVLSSQGRYSDALKSYNRALENRKYYATCYYNMGNLYLDLKQYSNALQHWQKAVKLNPRISKAWANILTMLDNQGLHEEALQLSSVALDHNPNDGTIMFIRANVFGKVKMYNEAESLYKQVIYKEPLNFLYYTNLGVLYHRCGKRDLAIENYQKALKVNPEKATTARTNLKKLIKQH